MKKIAFLNDGNTSIRYDSIQELNRIIPAPYSSFCPMQEFDGLLIGRENVQIGTYAITDNQSDDSSITDVDDLF